MLPFQTVHEAELALGRTLTSAERLWFRYSAQMLDFLLYSHNTFFLFLFFSLVPLLLALMELINPKPLQKYKLQPKVHLSPQTFFKCLTKTSSKYSSSPLDLISNSSLTLVSSGSGSGRDCHCHQDGRCYCTAGGVCIGGGLWALLDPPPPALPVGVREDTPAPP
ncbi:hypothetical protein AAC387_Pa08g1889 [Persea americana]